MGTGDILVGPIIKVDQDCGLIPPRSSNMTKGGDTFAELHLLLDPLPPSQFVLRKLKECEIESDSQTYHKYDCQNAHDYLEPLVQPVVF